MMEDGVGSACFRFDAEWINAATVGVKVDGMSVSESMSSLLSSSAAVNASGVLSSTVFPAFVAVCEEAEERGRK